MSKTEKTKILEILRFMSFCLKISNLHEWKIISNATRLVMCFSIKQCTTQFLKWMIDVYTCGGTDLQTFHCYFGNSKYKKRVYRKLSDVWQIVSAIRDELQITKFVDRWRRGHCFPVEMNHYYKNAHKFQYSANKTVFLHSWLPKTSSKMNSKFWSSRQ